MQMATLRCAHVCLNLIIIHGAWLPASTWRCFLVCVVENNAPHVFNSKYKYPFVAFLYIFFFFLFLPLFEATTWGNAAASAASPQPPCYALKQRRCAAVSLTGTSQASGRILGPRQERDASCRFTRLHWLTAHH